MKKQTIMGKPGVAYAKAVKANGFLFVSGNVAVNPETGKLVEGGIKEQTRQVLENLKGILEALGSSLEDVVKVNAYLVSMQDFSGMNEVYKEYFATDPPTRTTIGVQGLPGEGFLVEIDLMAAL